MQSQYILPKESKIFPDIFLTHVVKKKNQDSALCFKDIYSRITISFYLCKLYKEENIIESLDHFYATDQVNWYKITMFH